MQLSIIGMGLIGTSVGMAITAASLEKPQSSPLGAVEVVGYDTHSSAVKTAHRRRAITRIAPTLEAAVEQADVVMIATPRADDFTNLVVHCATSSCRGHRHRRGKYENRRLPMGTRFAAGVGRLHWWPPDGRQRAGRSRSR